MNVILEKKNVQIFIFQKGKLQYTIVRLYIAIHILISHNTFISEYLKRVKIYIYY